MSTKAGLKYLPIDSITYDSRYRTDMGDLETLSESIRDKGVLQPITVTTDLCLLAGERRIRAAKLAGLKEIPALIRKIEGEIDAREIELFENVHRKSFSWDEEATLIRDIDSLYKAQNLEWSGRKTATLLDKGVTTVARAIQLANAIDVIPELAEMKTADDALKTIKGMEERAIIHELRARHNNPENIGMHRGIKDALRVADKNYIIGDTFLGLAEVPSGSNINLIECDPPYGIELNTNKSGYTKVKSSVESYQEVKTDEYAEFLKKLTHELFRVANTNSWLIFWYGPTWHTECMSALREAGWLVDDIPGIWVKEQGQTLQPELYLARAYEPFFICRKGKPVITKRGRLNVFNYSGIPGAQKYHPTQRPVDLIEDLLETFALPGSVVLVPFLGSGATLRACYNQGMKCFGWDLNPEYKDNFMLKIESDSRELLNMEEVETEE